ncbi:MAG TPA: hypothetical protein VN843_09795 [Anaerolineales bacterium]|nr:hypothetical protein [Anaerolineales bacterium]
MSTDTQVQSVVTRDIDWARHHLFLLVAVAVLSIGSIYGIESILARRAHDQHVEDMAILSQMQKQNEQTQAAKDKQIETLTQQNAAALQQNAQLAQQFQTIMSAIAARDAQLMKDRQEIKTLPPSALATKWGAAASEPAPTISSNGDFDVTLPLAQKSYDALLQVPVLTKDNDSLKGNLQTETQIAQNNDTIAKNNESKFEAEQKAHISDTNVCTQTVKTLNDQIAEVKSNARKNNILYAVLGFLAHAVIGSKL